jgi:nickel-dependent lactate racemase
MSLGLVAQIGSPEGVLDDTEIDQFIREQLAGLDIDGQSVCLVIPDSTRSCHLPLLFRAVHGALAGRVSRLTAVVALGTHAAMDEERLAAHLGYPVRNHEWWDPQTFVSLGTISRERIAELSDGRLNESVDVRINRTVVEHDVALVIGPVFPPDHERRHHRHPGSHPSPFAHR